MYKLGGVSKIQLNIQTERSYEGSKVVSKRFISEYSKTCWDYTQTYTQKF